MKALIFSLLVSVSALAGQASGAGDRFDVPTPSTTDVISMAISPDGEKLVFVATVNRQSQLWVCRIQRKTEPVAPAARAAGAATDAGLSLCGESGRRLDDAEYLSFPFPFWSPDSGNVVFADGQKLRIVNIESGNKRTLLEWQSGAALWGGTWSKEGGGEGTILFATSGTPIVSVPAAGFANPVNVTTVRRPQENLHVFPSFLPDGRSFLYYVVGTPEARGVYAARIGGGAPRRLVDAETAAVYSSGRLFFVRKGDLLSQAFDLDTLTLSGEPAKVDERVPYLANIPALSASRTGRIAYRSGAASRITLDGTRIAVDVVDSVERQFTWFDRKGKELAKVGNPIAGMEYHAPSLSRDGRVAFGRTEDGNTDIWMLDTKTGELRRFTSDPARDLFPVWSPDGERLAFLSNRTAGWAVFMKPTAPRLAGTVETPILQSSSLPQDWSADGRFLVLSGGVENVVAAREKDGALLDVVRGARGGVIFPQVSPNGKWLAFQSAQSGKPEIYLAPFQPGSAFQPMKEPVSRNGGGWPRWSKDGKELFFVAPDGNLTAVPFDASTGRATGPAKPLFVPPMLGYTNQQNKGPQYMVSDDGRFLVATVFEVQSPIHVIEYPAAQAPRP